MIKKTSFFLLIILSLSCFLSACASSDKINRKLDLQNLSEASVQFEKIKEQEFSNFSFEDCVLNLPQVPTELYALRMMDPDSSMSNKAFYADFVSQFSHYFPTTTYNEDSVFTYDKNTHDFVLYKDVKNGFENESQDYSSLEYRSNEVYFCVFKSDTHVPFRMCKGEAARFLVIPDEMNWDTLGGWNYNTDPTSDSYYKDRQVAEYVNDGQHNGEVYHMVDGDLSIGDAIDYFENKYLSTLPLKYDNKLKLSVSEICVAKLAENVYGYNMYATVSYDGIDLDRRRFGAFFESNEYDYMATEAFMLRRDSIDSYYGIPNYKFEEIGDSITNIVSLEDAIDIASKELSQNVKFDVNRIDLVYQLKRESEPTDAVRSYGASLAWRITALNTNDTKTYVVYVDAVTGAVRYYNTL